MKVPQWKQITDDTWTIQFPVGFVTVRLVKAGKWRFTFNGHKYSNVAFRTIEKAQHAGITAFKVRLVTALLAIKHIQKEMKQCRSSST